MAENNATEFLDSAPKPEELADKGRKENEEKLKRYELDPSVDYGEPQYVFDQGGIGFSPRGDLQVVKAPQKNGKTFLFSLLIGALIKGEYLGIHSRVQNPKIVYIDTEQHPRNTQLVYKRACFIGGIDGSERHANFTCYHMRGLEPEDILTLVQTAIRKHKPDVLFLDGVRDCVHDFNDIAESGEAVRLLMELAMKNDCSIWSVLHVNPGSDKMKGHLGTEMQNKVSDVFSCVKQKTLDGTVFTVEQTDTRNRDINKFSFVIEDRKNGDEYIAIPCQTHISIKEKSEADDIMAKALKDKPLRYNDLKDAIVEIAGCCQKTAKNRIKTAIESGVIAKDNVTYRYYYVGQGKEEDEELPF